MAYSLYSTLRSNNSSKKTNLIKTDIISILSHLLSFNEKEKDATDFS